MFSDYKAVAYIYFTFITVSMGKYCKYFRNRVSHTDKLKCLSSVNAIYSHLISYAERFKMPTSIIKEILKILELFCGSTWLLDATVSPDPVAWIIQVYFVLQWLGTINISPVFSK